MNTARFRGREAGIHVVAVKVDSLVCGLATSPCKKLTITNNLTGGFCGFHQTDSEQQIVIREKGVYSFELDMSTPRSTPSFIVY